MTGNSVIWVKRLRPLIFWSNLLNKLSLYAEMVSEDILVILIYLNKRCRV